MDDPIYTHLKSAYHCAKSCDVVGMRMLLRSVDRALNLITSDIEKEREISFYTGRSDVPTKMEALVESYKSIYFKVNNELDKIGYTARTKDAMKGLIEKFANDKRDEASEEIDFIKDCLLYVLDDKMPYKQEVSKVLDDVRRGAKDVRKSFIKVYIEDAIQRIDDGEDIRSAELDLLLWEYTADKNLIDNNDEITNDVDSLLKTYLGDI